MHTTTHTHTHTHTHIDLLHDYRTVNKPFSMASLLSDNDTCHLHLCCLSLHELTIPFRWMGSEISKGHVNLRITLLSVVEGYHVPCSVDGMNHKGAVRECFNVIMG